ncbi:glutaminyl-peptide cyclotransferase-like protein isoform X2 [Balearica regulorum gibbericeps]|uniref:glutaminyl-peptide cyclotransferase-like protein isoform X2 n=1 Tax=Balearica regulorum gibbericeps TaxID=100784 RepID=UPI003F60CA72
MRKGPGGSRRARAAGSGPGPGPVLVPVPVPGSGLCPRSRRCPRPLLPLLALAAAVAFLYVVWPGGERGTGPDPPGPHSDPALRALLGRLDPTRLRDAFLRPLLRERVPGGPGSRAARQGAEVTLQLLFLDGEEAFGDWSATDSLYGARHLAARMAATPHGPRGTQITAMSLLVLLDLLGAPHPAIHSHFPRTHHWFLRLVAIEQRLRRLGLLHAPPQAQPFFRLSPAPGPVEDDHVPFLQRGKRHQAPNSYLQTAALAAPRDARRQVQLVTGPACRCGCCGKGGAPQTPHPTGVVPRWRGNGGVYRQALIRQPGMSRRQKPCPSTLGAFWCCRCSPEGVAGVSEPGVTATLGFKAPEKPNYCFQGHVFLRAAAFPLRRVGGYGWFSVAVSSVRFRAEPGGFEGPRDSLGGGSPVLGAAGFQIPAAVLVCFPLPSAVETAPLPTGSSRFYWAEGWPSFLGEGGVSRPRGLV